MCMDYSCGEIVLVALADCGVRLVEHVDRIACRVRVWCCYVETTASSDIDRGVVHLRTTHSTTVCTVRGWYGRGDCVHVCACVYRVPCVCDGEYVYINTVRVPRAPRLTWWAHIECTMSLRWRDRRFPMPSYIRPRGGEHPLHRHSRYVLSNQQQSVDSHQTS